MERESNKRRYQEHFRGKAERARNHNFSTMVIHCECSRQHRDDICISLMEGAKGLMQIEQLTLHGPNDDVGTTGLYDEPCPT